MASKEELTEILQKIFEAEAGLKISKEKCWKVFKGIIYGIADVCLADEDDRLILSGVGRFEIKRNAPRSTKVGVVDFVPRLRYRPSSKMNEKLEEAMGQVPDPDKMAKVRAKMEKDGTLQSNLPPREKKADAPATKEPTAAEKKKAAAAKKKADAAAKKKAADGKKKGAASDGADTEGGSDDFDDNF